MPRPRGAKARAEVVAERLVAEYPIVVCALDHRNAFELLAATILSAQCTDERVNMVTPELFRRWPTPAALSVAPPEEVQEVIHSTGFFRQKAKSILQACGDIVSRHGGRVPDTLEALVELRGVGRVAEGDVPAIVLAVLGAAAMIMSLYEVSSSMVALGGKSDGH